MFTNNSRYKQNKEQQSNKATPSCRHWQAETGAKFQQKYQTLL